MGAPVTYGQLFVMLRPVARPRARVLCLAHAGGGASEFRGWEHGLPDDCELLAAQLPGRQGRYREAPLRSAAAAVDTIGRALAPYVDVPLVMFGHSMGALLGFEVARYLRREWGVLPLHLVVSGRAGAATGNAESVGLARLPDAELVEVLRCLAGPGPQEALTDELVEVVLPTLRADLELCESYTYRPEPPLGCPITALAGRDDVAVPPGSLRRWARETSSTFTALRAAGGHHYVRRDRSVAVAVLRNALDEVVA